MGATEVAERPGSTAPARVIERDSVSYALAVWREWLQQSDSHRLGYPSRASGIRGTGAQDFDEMCHSMDERTARAVDACVDDLPRAERAAVYTVVLAPRRSWMQPDALMVVYERAREMLRVALKRRGIE